MLVTAAHCINHGNRLTAPTFSSIVFAPGYHKDTRPEPDRIAVAGPLAKPWGLVTRGVHYTKWRRNGGGRGTGNIQWDYAFLRTRPQFFTLSGVRKYWAIHEVLPFASIAFNYDIRYWRPRPDYGRERRQIWINGYPSLRSADHPFNGAVLWQCLSTYHRTDMNQSPPRMFDTSCDMSPGSSGGGWFSPWRGDRRSTLLTVQSQLSYIGQGITLTTSGQARHTSAMMRSRFGVTPVRGSDEYSETAREGRPRCVGRSS